MPPTDDTSYKDHELKQLPILEVTTLRGETKERWRELCERIVVEQDPDKLLTTIEELLQVLEEREEIIAQRRVRVVRVVRVPPSEKPYITCPVP